MGDSLFISDLHLAPAEPGAVQAFHRFLQGPARSAQALYILGDLFEYWAGDDDLAEPFNAEICAALSALARAGVKVHFMRGNRDFLAGPGFAQAAGLCLIDEPYVISLGGEPVLLMHGDALCTDDLAYQAFRAQVRDPLWQSQFLAQPLAARKKLIAALRERSETEKQGKAMSIMDVNAAAVVEAMRAQGVRKLIHGHTHRPAHHTLTLDGQDAERWVLSDWCKTPAFLRASRTGFSVEHP